MRHFTVSRRHARVIFNADSDLVYYEDLNSANGSQINGEKVTGKILLKDGMLI